MTHPFPVQEREELAARPPRETLYAAKRALFERNNKLLLLALGVVSLALCAVLFWTHGVYVASLEREPIVVRYRHGNRLYYGAAAGGAAHPDYR